MLAQRASVVAKQNPWGTGPEAVTRIRDHAVDVSSAGSGDHHCRRGRSIHAEPIESSRRGAPYPPRRIAHHVMDYETTKFRGAGQRRHRRQIDAHQAVARTDPQHPGILQQAFGRVVRGKAVAFGDEFFTRPAP